MRVRYTVGGYYRAQNGHMRRITERGESTETKEYFCGANPNLPIAMLQLQSVEDHPREQPMEVCLYCLKKALDDLPHAD